MKNKNEHGDDPPPLYVVNETTFIQNTFKEGFALYPSTKLTDPNKNKQPEEQSEKGDKSVDVTDVNRLVVRAGDSNENENQSQFMFVVNR